MPSRRKRLVGAAIERRLKMGFGQGEGADYRPWLRVTDVPSRGTCTILTGWKHGREHHLLSRIERNYFYCLEWSDDVVDIKEQKPLMPLAATLDIARNLGTRHPSSHGEPIVMTTDFLISVWRNGELQTIARAVKSEKDLADRRVLEKLEIEHRFWQGKNIDWGIVTEKDIPEPIWRNLEWLHECRDISNLEPITAVDVERVQAWITLRLATKSTVRTAMMCMQADHELQLPPGTSLKVLRHLLANKIFHVDITSQLRADIPVTLNLREVSRG